MTNALASDLALALDPVTLARRIGMDPDQWQVDMLRSSSPRILLNVHRQGGKSMMAALIAVHTALYEPGSLILLVSSSQRQSSELFRKCLTFYRTLGRPTPASAENQLSLELENGSRIVSLPGSETTIRSYSAVRLIILDEAAQVEDETYFAVRPMLAVSSGRIIAMSTPYGRRGWWHDAWTADDQAWERFEVKATACPRISAEFLEEERRSMGSWWFAQEYLCEFKETVDQIFTLDQVEAMFSPTIEPLFAGGLRG